MEVLQGEPFSKILLLARHAHSLQYHGKMSFKGREESIEQFQNDPERMIMIASLKCGGIGLVRQSLFVKIPETDTPSQNLTTASRVICVDLWFNSLVEQQGMKASIQVCGHH